MLTYPAIAEYCNNKNNNNNIYMVMAVGGANGISCG